MKLALFGGSFDPPHLGHLAFARFVLESLSPDRLVWLPAGRQWQKPDQVMAAGSHRAAMIARLIASEPQFRLDERELQRRGPSFTADTLREFSSENPGAELMFLIGQDQYARLSTWYQVKTVVALAKPSDKTFSEIKKGDLIVYWADWAHGNVIHQAAQKDSGGWIMSGLHNAQSESFARVTAESFRAVIEEVYVW